MNDIELEWRPIAGFHEYEINYHGDIRRAVDNAYHRGRSAGTAIRGWLHSRSGYRFVRLTNHPMQRKVLAVHRLVATAFIGPQPSPEHEVAHFDGDKLNNDFRNLRWATSGENTRDNWRHGNMPARHQNGASTLTWETVREIRRLAVSGHTNVELAARFGVSPGNISIVTTGRTWADVPADAAPNLRPPGDDAGPIVKDRRSPIITPELVRTIRARYEACRTQKTLVALAQEIGVCSETVRTIARRKSWRHVD